MATINIKSTNIQALNSVLKKVTGISSINASEVSVSQMGDVDKNLLNDANLLTSDGSNIVDDASFGLGSILTQNDFSISFTDYIYAGDKTSVNFNIYELSGAKTSAYKMPPRKVNRLYRNIGLVDLQAGYEPRFAAPIDARTRVPDLVSLYSPLWWLGRSKTPTYIYKGMCVSVESELSIYMYTGLDLCIKGNDVNTAGKIDANNWKRVSFAEEDFINTDKVVKTVNALPHSSILNKNGKDPYKNNKALFVSAQNRLGTLGITLGDKFMLMGQHKDPNLYSTERTFSDINGYDDFIGLSIIPNLGNGEYVPSRVELANVDGPVQLRATYLNNIKKVDYKSEIKLSKDVEIISSNSNIIAQCNTLNLENTQTIKTSNLSINSTAIKHNITNSLQLTSSNILAKNTGGLYISNGTEMNFITGAFAVQSTGYNSSAYEKTNAILLKPLGYNLNKGVYTAQTNNNSTVIIEGVRNKKDTTQVILYSNDNNTTTMFGSKSSSVYSTTATSNYAGIHAFNQRLDPIVYNLLVNSIDKNTIDIVDLTDTNNLYNTEYTVNGISDTEFKEKLKTKQITDTSNLISILTEGDTIWVNKSEKTTDTNNTSINPKYAIISTDNNKLTPSILSALSELINTGTVTLESFGDTSIYSKFGKILLGEGGFVGLDRKKQFVVAPDISTYFKVAKDKIQIRNFYNEKEPAIIDISTHNLNLNGTSINLNTDNINFWNKIKVKKPTITDNKKYLAYIKDTVNNTEELTWVNDHTLKGSLTGITSPNYYKLGNLNINDIMKNLPPNSNDNNDNDRRYMRNIQLNFNLNTGFFNGNIKVILQLAKNGVGAHIVDNTIKLISANTFAVSVPTNGSTAFKPYQAKDETSSTNTSGFTPIEAVQTSYVSAIVDIMPLLLKPVYTSDTITSIEFYTPAGQDTIITYNDYSYIHWDLQLLHSDGAKWEQSNVEYHVTAINSTEDNQTYIKNQYISEYTQDSLYAGNTHSIIPITYHKNFYTNITSIDNINKVQQPSNIKVSKTDDNDTIPQNQYLVYNKDKGLNWSPITVDIPEYQTGININLFDVNNKDSTGKKMYLVGTKETPDSNSTKNTIETYINNKVYFDAAGDLHANQIYGISDKRMKGNIEELNIHTKFPSLKQFNLKTENNELSYGLIAQEVEEAGYTNLVSTDESGLKHLNYLGAYAVIIKELQDKVKELENEINKLKQQ